MPEPLTPEQRLALIKQIESQETASRRRAIWITWASVGVAAIVLGAIVFGAKRDLARSQAAVERSKVALADIEARVQKALADLKEAEQARAAAEEARAAAQKLGELALGEYRRAVELVEALLKKVPDLKAEAEDLTKRAADARNNLELLQREAAALPQDRPKTVSTYFIEIAGIDAIGISRDHQWDVALRRNDTKRVLLSLTAGGKRKPPGPDEFISVGSTLLGSRTKPVSLQLEEGSVVDLAIDAVPADPEHKVRRQGSYRLVAWHLGGLLFTTRIPIVVQVGRSEGVLLADLVIRRTGTATAKP